MSLFFFGNDGQQSQSLQDAIRKAFEQPGSNAPATWGHVLALVAKLIGFDRHNGRLHMAHSSALSKLDGLVRDLTTAVAGVERRFKTFDPMVYLNREAGTRTMRMETADQVVTISTSVEHGEKGILKREARRLDSLAERVDQIACRVDTMATVLKSLADAAGIGLALGLADRGIFKVGEEYRRGEWATHQGSLWICTVETTSDRPGTSAAWRLAVKSGRDGRDAIGQH